MSTTLKEGDKIIAEIDGEQCHGVLEEIDDDGGHACRRYHDSQSASQLCQISRLT